MAERRRADGQVVRVYGGGRWQQEGKRRVCFHGGLHTEIMVQ